MKNKYYVTTPIYYASGDLTVGHCFCTVLTDACARFFRLNGDDVFFLTGSDEHGLKIARKAEEAHVTPQEFVDKTVEHFKYVWNKLGISYDKFIRTTDKEHVECVKKIAQALFDKGYIYKGTYKGLYCVPCETFYSEGQLVDGKCPECHRDVEPTNVEAYFFKMSAFQDYLEKLFKDDHFLVPESRRTEIYNNFVKPGVTDLCISRNTFDWGIPLPFDSKHVIYVWIDALTNYISALGYGSKDDSLYKKFWPADVHFVGRDITRFHAMIWPAILKALDIPAPKQIHSTGFITLKGDKISKSKSNGFNPLVLIDRYGVDALRYYLIKEGPIFDDIPYASDVFLNTINADLCNTYGNLVS
ncbi:MAG: methionine--tRNA ligase, partial [Clostridia bacterium]|nr:methionine--tRNA ligase [Clostridia bacterium]